jgi:hypothetical protein
MTYLAVVLEALEESAASPVPQAYLPPAHVIGTRALPGRPALDPLSGTRRMSGACDANEMAADTAWAVSYFK